MLKRSLSLLLAIAVLLALVACKPDPVSQNGGIDSTVLTEYVLDGEPLVPQNSGGVRFGYNGIADLTFIFSITADEHAHLMRSCFDLNVTATVLDGKGSNPIDVIPTEVGEVDGLYIYEVSVGGIFAEDYLLSHTATLTLSFRDSGGRAHQITAESSPACVYDVAHAEYCDRTLDSDGDHRHFHNGFFSPYADLSAHYAVLCSVINIEIELGTPRDLYENEYYSSLYSLDYFDGLLTVSMKNGGMINEGLLRRITLDGEEIYYEVHDGIIRIVLEN